MADNDLQAKLDQFVSQANELYGAQAKKLADTDEEYQGLMKQANSIKSEMEAIADKWMPSDDNVPNYRQFKTHYDELVELADKYNKLVDQINEMAEEYKNTFGKIDK